MSLNCGIVGLPNVGKSTLFNALLAKAHAEAANFPFCTIEPNVGKVFVPDERLDNIAKIAGSAEVIPTSLEFVDIAGLVRGASKGEGLGNQFLGHIRQVDAIIHVLRCFEDDDITHVEDSVDPIRDKEIIDTELLLADLESIEKRIVGLTKKARGNDAEAKELLEIANHIAGGLSDGKSVRQIMPDLSPEQQQKAQSLEMITAKPVLYVCNVDEDSVVAGNEYSSKITDIAQQEGAKIVRISAKIEAEISALEDEEEKQEFMNDMGMSEPGLHRIIRAGYELLDLLTFFTAGPKEARGWTVRHGAKAPEAAGVIHTDFEKGFIRAETIAYDDYIANNGESGAKEAGKLRLEGKEYLVQDGDVFHFRFNV